ncbi:hypothetical protein ACFQU7_00195 [Pseudoroseomonas wenyumeiae]
MQELELPYPRSHLAADVAALTTLAEAGQIKPPAVAKPSTGMAAPA